MTARHLAAVAGTGAGIAVCWALIVIAGPGHPRAVAAMAAAGLVWVALFLAAWRRAFGRRP